MFETLKVRYDVAKRRNDLATQEAVLKALTWFASRPWIRTLPDWVLALGITPAAVVPPPSASKPATWGELLAQFNNPSPSVNPTTRSPKGWAAADALIGHSARGLILGTGLSVIQQRLALDVVWPLLLAADGIESSLSPGASETPAHAVWRSDVAAVNALIADIDGGASSGSTARELALRLQLARSNPELASGKAALARAISIPTEPPLDSALIDAAEAFRLFFT